MPTPNQTPNGISFDAPLQQATTVTVPAGVTFDAPTTQPTTVAPGGQPTAQPQPSQSQPFKPTATVSAVPEPANMAESIERWADQVKNDLMNGSSNTKVGALLKFLGAPGLERGVSQGAAEFMGSPLLGPTRVARGAAELGQSGKRWDGTKDVVGGALDTATIPGGFIAPEGGEVAGSALDATATQAARAAKAVRDAASKSFDVHSVQESLHSSLRDVFNTIARDENVSPQEATSIRDVAHNLSDALRGRASSIYQKLDAATGGRFQRFSDALSNIERGMRDSLGVDPDKYEALVERKAEVEAAQKQALDEARKAGVNPELIDHATAIWKRQSALQDLGKAVRQSVKGQRPEVAKGGTATPETVSPAKLFASINRLHDKGRLAEAIGPENAARMLEAVDTAYLQAQKIATRNKFIKEAAKATGLGALGYETVSGLHHLVESQ